MQRLLFLLVSVLFSSSGSQLFGMKTDPPKRTLMVARLKFSSSSGSDKTPSFFDLMNACSDHNKEGVGRLLKRKDMAIDGEVEQGETALRLACNNGNEDIVRKLLRAGANPNVQTDLGKTCLHDLCEQEHVSVGIVKLLLKHKKIDPNIKDNDGTSPLFCVAQTKNISLLNLFLACKNINLDEKNKYNQTFFYVAYACDTFKELTDLDFFRRFNTQQRKEFLQDQLCQVTVHSLGSGLSEKISLFMDICVGAGVDLNKKNSEDKIPLEQAYAEYMCNYRGIKEQHGQAGIKNNPILMFKEDVFYAFLLRTPLATTSLWSRLGNIIMFLVMHECERIKSYFFDGGDQERAEVIEKITKTLYPSA